MEKKKDGKINRWSGRVSASGKGWREGVDEKSERRGGEEATVITLN